MAHGSEPPRSSEERGKPRSARHVKTAARLLQKEARSILKRHVSRIASDPAEDIRACIAAIDTHRAAGDIEALEREAERLDELLHQHATFARKSALRETLENVGIAVLIALGLRSCFYEPFKIPSGSMMPTLRNGDHIFVNKFIYGVQIPFTSTVVGESWGNIERGEVLVFRYPLNESEDFIKRVIGLPGDEIKVSGRAVSIKRAGETEFELLAHEPLEEPCYDEDNKTVVEACQLFRETLGDRSYVVRYLNGFDAIDDVHGPARVWKVPADRLLVMGDNRNQSHDSLAWSVRVEAVNADDVLRDKDLRDVTDGKLFTLTRPTDIDDFSDPSHDHVTYQSSHRAPSYDLSLAIWRDPPIPAPAIYEAIAQRTPNGRSTRVAQLLAGAPDDPKTDRARQVGAALDSLTIGDTGTLRHAVAFLEPAKAVLELRCGHAQCPTETELALQFTEIIGRFEQDHDQDAREIAPRADDARYSTHWTGRSDIRDHFHATRLHVEGQDADPSQDVSLRALRKPKPELDVLQDAALRQFGVTTVDAPRLPALGERAWLMESAGAFHVVAADPEREMLIMLDCGRARCASATAATTLAQTVWARVPEAAADRRKMRSLLVPSDMPGTVLDPVRPPDRDAYDRVGLEATVEGKDHTLDLEIWRHPPEGLAAKIAALRGEYGLKADTRVAPGGAFGEDEGAFHFAVPVEESETVFRMRCRKGLCPTAEVATHVARRAHANAVDPTNFVDPEAERPRPFVPRGNVKGRAERIWLPLRRFWLPIE